MKKTVFYFAAFSMLMFVLNSCNHKKVESSKNILPVTQRIIADDTTSGDDDAFMPDPTILVPEESFTPIKVTGLGIVSNVFEYENDTAHIIGFDEIGSIATIIFVSKKDTVFLRMGEISGRTGISFEKIHKKTLEVFETYNRIIRERPSNLTVHRRGKMVTSVFAGKDGVYFRPLPF